MNEIISKDASGLYYKESVDEIKPLITSYTINKDSFQVEFDETARLSVDIDSPACSTNPLEVSLYTAHSRMNKAIEIALQYGRKDHKAWVIDQMLRVLTGDNYKDIVPSNWDKGISPIQ